MTTTTDLVRKLRQFGIPEAEGHLYFHLCRLGRSTATDITREARVARTEGYRHLARLEERGLVEKTLERPARFVPVPVREVLDRLMERRRQDLNDLANQQEAVLRAWPQGEALDGSGRRISIHQGRHQVQGLLERIIDGAREDLLFSASLRSFSALDTERILRRLDAKQRHGVPVRILARVEAPDLPFVRRLARVATVRHLELGEYHEMLIADTDAIALFVGGTHARDPDGGPETLLHLTAPPFVMTQKTLLDQEWNRAIDLADRIQELRTGRFPEQAELVRGRWMRTERMKQMLLRNDRVTILAPAHELGRWEANGIARLLRRRLAEGCAMIVLSDGLSVADAGTDADAGFQVTHVAGPHRLLVLGGNQELLTVEDCPGTAGTTNEAEWGTWTTIPSALDEARDRLDGLLSRATS